MILASSLTRSLDERPLEILIYHIECFSTLGELVGLVMGDGR